MVDIWNMWLEHPRFSLSTWAGKLYVKNKDEKLRKYVIHPIDALSCMEKLGDDEELREIIIECDTPRILRDYHDNVRNDILEVNEKLFGKE